MFSFSDFYIKLNGTPNFARQVWMKFIGKLFFTNMQYEEEIISWLYVIYVIA